MTGRVAVIGSGVAGLTAAHVLARQRPVVLFEADTRPGGHAHSHDVDLGDGRLARVDSGFLVHNDRTYPTLNRLFDELGIQRHATTMSMSVRQDGAGRRGLEYAGAKKLTGLFADPRNLARPAYLRMLGEVLRFQRAARAQVAASGPGLSPADAAGPDGQRLGSWLEEGGYSEFFLANFMRPLIAAVWSCDPQRALDYPASYLLHFLDHHGMLGLSGSPAWSTIVGGSGTYVDKVLAGLDEVRLGSPVAQVREHSTGVRITEATGRVTEADAVVVATHPRQGLDLLAEPSESQREVLGIDAVLGELRPAAHRHQPAAHQVGGPGCLELPGSGPGRWLWRSGDLRRHPADGPTGGARTPLPGHPQRRPPGAARDGAGHHDLRAPALHPGLGRCPTVAASGRDRQDRLRRRLPRWGFHEDGAPGPGWPRPASSVPTGTHPGPGNVLPAQACRSGDGDENHLPVPDQHHSPVT